MVITALIAIIAIYGIRKIFSFDNAVEAWSSSGDNVLGDRDDY